MAALSSSRRAALRETIRPTSRGAIDRYLATPERIEARWLWLRVFGVALTAAFVAASVGHPTIPAWTLGLLASVVGYAIPSELLRAFAVHRASEWAPTLLRVLAPLELLVAPLSDPIWFLADKIAGREKAPLSAELAETEVELIVNEGEQNGSFSADESAMIRNVLEFREVTAEDVMVPRIHVDSLEASLPLSDALKVVLETQHSRYPVYSESVDNIVGILHVKDLFAQIHGETDPSSPVSQIARRPVAFVPENQSATVVLKDMRVGRHHLAVVVDEFGGVSGIVTLEDLLEEIVGDIQDEHDRDDGEARIRPLESGGLLVDASLAVDDVNQALGTELPEGDYVSLGGLLVEHLGTIPSPGSTHELLGMRVVIREADPRHVAWVELEKLPESSADPLIEQSA